MCGGGYVQCRVAGVDVMTNGDKEVWLWILATRSDPKGIGDQTRRLVEHSRDPDVVMRGNRGKEREQGNVEVIDSSTCPHHRYRLSDLGLGRSLNLP